MNSIEAFWSSVRDALVWAPDWLSAIAILLLAAIAALVVHRVVFALIDGRLGERHPFLRRVLLRTKGPLALALVAFALAAALQTAPVGEGISATFGRLLLIAFIVLAGWIAHIAVETGSNVYLRHFTLEADDNLLARKHVTQVRILKRALHSLIVVVTLSAVLMTFESVRQWGVSLFASAGVAGLVAGLAARPVLSNLIAGIQIATAQPIRIDDQVVIEGESGRIEEITSTYVVVRLWDLRRLIVPLSYFIEKPFQNWTRDSTDLLGTVVLHVDFTAPIEAIRAKLVEIVQASKLWDGKVVKLQVTDAREVSIELRALVSARSAGDAFDLRCDIREQLIAFLQQNYPTALPHARAETIIRPPSPQARHEPLQERQSAVPGEHSPRTAAR
jgi:small-conductance mechanosensitive channel